jgi:hypothetical protein
MYRLPQAGIIVQELLAKRLKEHGYTQSRRMPGLWTHEWRPITFSLVLDNLEVKYIGEEHAQHLLQMVKKILYVLIRKGRGKILQTHHQVGLCWQEGAPFDAIIHWEDIKALSASPTYRTTGPAASAHQKDIWCKSPSSKPTWCLPTLNKAGKKFIQEVTGAFLYLAQAVDLMMLTALSSLASGQAAPTERMMQKCLQFLDYPASQEDTIVTYRASNMRLAIHSSTSYLSEPKAHSRAGGYIFMAGTEDIPINNGVVLNISQIIRAVMSSAAETKLGALFINTKMAVSMWRTLKEMGRPQTCTPIQTDNLTAHTLLNNKIMPKALKAMDMQFYWLRCQEAQDQYCFYWRPGTQNLADYWTKHHSASYHKAFWPKNLTSSTSKPATEVFPSSCKNFHPIKTLKNTATKSFVKKILMTPSFVERLAAKITNNCSQRRLMAQQQGCVRLAGSTSWGKDKYPRPRPIRDRILQNTIPAKPHSIVQYVTRLDMTSKDPEARKEGSLPPSLFTSNSRLTPWTPTN